MTEEEKRRKRVEDWNKEIEESWDKGLVAMVKEHREKIKNK